MSHSCKTRGALSSRKKRNLPGGLLISHSDFRGQRQLCLAMARACGPAGPAPLILALCIVLCCTTAFAQPPNSPNDWDVNPAAFCPSACPGYGSVRLGELSYVCSPRTSPHIVCCCARFRPRTCAVCRGIRRTHACFQFTATLARHPALSRLFACLRPRAQGARDAFPSWIQQ